MSSVVTGATTTGAQTVTAANILENILEIAKDLDELNIPEEGRYVVLPPSVISLLKQSELRQAYLTGDGTSPRNDQVGQVDRFTVYQSNLLYTPSSGTDATHPRSRGSSQGNHVLSVHQH